MQRINLPGLKAPTVKQRAAMTMEEHRQYFVDLQAAMLKADPAILIARLEKVRVAISNAAARGRSVNGCHDLIDTYEALREALLASEAGNAAWALWCDARGASKHHDAYDLFA